MRNGLPVGTTVIFLLLLSYVVAFPLFTAHAQRATPEPVAERATPVPPTPTPIAIVIEESVSVGETSGNRGLDPITESIGIEDSTSSIDQLNETIVIGDSTYSIDQLNETIVIGDQTAVELGKSLVNQQTKSSDRNQGADEREKKSRDAFSRGTGSVKEDGEGSDNGGPSVDRNAGSAWMVVVYVVIGLVAVALFGLLGRRLRRRMQD
jgi:hypothetical protein